MTRVYAPGYEPGFEFDFLGFLNTEVLGIPGLLPMLAVGGVLFLLVSRMSPRATGHRSSFIGMHDGHSGLSALDRKKGLLRRILRLS